MKMYTNFDFVLIVIVSTFLELETHMTSLCYHQYPTKVSIIYEFHSYINNASYLLIIMLNVHAR